MTKRQIYLLFAGLLLIYTVLTLTAPDDQEVIQKYRISSLQLRLLNIMVAIPIMIIWGFAVCGYVRLRDYAQGIKGNNDGLALAAIADGIGIMAFGGPLVACVNAFIRNLTVNDNQLMPRATVLRNYLSMLVVFVAFLLTYYGTGKLRQIVKRRAEKRAYVLTLAIYAVFAAGYIVLAFIDVSRNKNEGIFSTASHYLPWWVIALTIVLPYLYAWYTGLFSAMRINYYRRYVKGVIYKQALGYLAWGIGIVIATTLVGQYLGSLSETLEKLSLMGILQLLYVILSVYGFGFYLIARGAEQLRKIEEV